jgi:hypothetical protein
MVKATNICHRLRRCQALLGMASRDETEPDKEGFSEHQALVVIGQILAGGMKEKD